MTKLEKILFSNNQIKSLENNIFSKMSLLEVIDFSKSKFNAIKKEWFPQYYPEYFRGLKIDFSKNQKKCKSV